MALTPIASSLVASTTSAPVSSTGVLATSVSELYIWNSALSMIGARSSISSPTENSPQARECSLRYPMVRDTLLRAAPWDFAERDITAGLLKAAPGTPENNTSGGVWDDSYPKAPWLYSYLYPADCIRLLRVKMQPYQQSVDALPYQTLGSFVENGMVKQAIPFKKALEYVDDKQRIVILTNQKDAIFSYTARITNVALYDSLFMNALTAALASELAMPLTGSPQFASLHAQKANELIMQARLTDANESANVIEQVPDWLQARGVTSISQPSGMLFEPYGPLFGTY